MTERLLPAPDPHDLPTPLDGEIVELPPGALWARLYFHTGRHPTRWDRFRHVDIPTPSRFDAFRAPAVDGVAYATVPTPAGGPFDVTEPLRPGDSSALATSVLEAAQDTRMLDRLDQRSFAVAELTQPLRVLDLASDWAARAGAGSHLSTAPRRETARWATAIAARWPELHGVAYPAATRPAGRAIALWYPAAAAAVTTSKLLLLRTLDDPVLRGALAWAAHTTGVRLLTR